MQSLYGIRKVCLRNNTVSGIPPLIDRDMIRQQISTMNNEKTTRLSGAVSEMTDAAGEPGADMIIDLVNQIMVE